MEVAGSELSGFDVDQVLHMDRNDYYGGESTSMNLKQVNIQIFI